MRRSFDGVGLRLGKGSRETIAEMAPRRSARGCKCASTLRQDISALLSGSSSRSGAVPAEHLFFSAMEELFLPR